MIGGLHQANADPDPSDRDLRTPPPPPSPVDVASIDAPAAGGDAVDAAGLLASVDIPSLPLGDPRVTVRRDRPFRRRATRPPVRSLEKGIGAEDLRVGVFKEGGEASSVDFLEFVDQLERSGGDIARRTGGDTARRRATS